MNILLTGSSGFLGKNFVKYISHNINTLNRTNSDINCDLAFEIPIIEKSFDLIIHNAGKAHLVPKNEKDKNLFHQINVIGTRNLLAGLATNIPKKFVFISSVSVYGLIEGENINETYPLLAEDPYGKSKIEAEEIIINWCNEHNIIYTILRLPLVYGINPPGNLGSMIKAIKNGYYFNIAGGYTKKSMILASDVAKFIIKASEIGGTYNLTDGINPSFKELSNNISHQLGKSFVPNVPFFVAYILAKIGDIVGNIFPINSNILTKITSNLTFDDSKARRNFGWTPRPVLDEFKSKNNV